MPDYHLAGLSPRSFEQLIQSLAAKIIGPNVVVFGDGRDGGREATFDGAIPFPSREHGWRGYGVVQAKFKQQPEDRARDGAWALQQLESDLKKFVDPTRKLRQPQYYIFATNVVLTPVADSGSKDKAIALFKKYAPELGLLDFAIWDYDTIRGFLDDNEDIRRAYSAWITSGDVLAEVMTWFKARQPDFASIITTFLQKELVADQYAGLEQAGHSRDDRIPLARVFVDLPVSAERKSEPPDEKVEQDRLPPGFVAEMLTAAADRLDTEALHSWRAGRLVGERGPQLPGRFVLIGGPGQGKSTVGQFICQLFRVALLQGMPEHPLRDDVNQARREIEQQCQREGIALPTARRFPLRVVLNDFAARLEPSHANHVDSLLSYLVDRIRKRTSREIAVDDFREWLRAYPWLLVLDGLDEVPASSNRAEVLDALKAFWIDAADCNADLLVIATTRPQGYNDDFSPAQYQHRWLLPLSRARALHYAGRLAELRHAKDPDRQEKVLDQMRRAAANDATARLMSSPLQVTIMAVLVARMGQPPQDRWSLFKSYYDVIYQRELERNIPASQVLREHKTDIEAIHRQVGLLLQLESERAGGTDARLSEQRFTAIVRGRLGSEGYGGAELARLSRQIIEAATERLVFLVGLEADQVGFELRSLQEFMAAEGLMDGGDDLIRARLREIAPIVSWRNVFLFAAGKCFAEREHLRETIYTICGELNDPPDDEAAHVTLAGSQLALDLLEDGPARSKPHFARSFVRIALRLLDLPFGVRHIRLADLYDGGLEQVYREEIERRLALVETTQGIGAWACLAALLEKEAVWTEELTQRYWANPGSEHAQLLLWLLDQGRGVGWAANRLIEITPRISPLDLQPYAVISQVIGQRDIAVPEWFVYVAEVGAMATDIHNDAKLYIPLETSHPEDNASIDFERVFIFQWKSRSIHPLQNMPNPAAEWMPLIASVRFAGAPSKEALARELRVIAEHWACKSIDWLIEIAPWPLSTCVAACDNAQQVLTLADRVAAGELGDVHDWQAAEERWNDQGVTFADIEYMSDSRWPFDRRIAQQGFPFAHQECWIGFSEHLLQQVLMLYERLPIGYMRTEVAEWLAILIPESGSMLTTNLSKIQSLLDEQTSTSRFLAVLGSLVRTGLLDEGWIESVDQRGRRLALDAAWRAFDITDWLAQAFRLNVTRVGILRLLAAMVLGTGKPNLPSTLVDPARFDEAEDREAAAIVRLALDIAQREEAANLALFVAEFAAHNQQRALQALSVTRDYRADEPFNEVFLLELLQRTPSTQSNLKSQIISELNDALRRRTSRLHAREVWEQLGLPEGLSTI